jgi:hypothetical protein
MRAHFKLRRLRMLQFIPWTYKKYISAPQYSSSSLGAKTLCEFWPAQQFSSMLLYPQPSYSNSVPSFFPDPLWHHPPILTSVYQSFLLQLVHSYSFHRPFFIHSYNMPNPSYSPWQLNISNSNNNNNNNVTFYLVLLFQYQVGHVNRQNA